jgi:hypothetical protein
MDIHQHRDFAAVEDRVGDRDVGEVGHDDFIAGADPYGLEREVERRRTAGKDAGMAFAQEARQARFEAGDLRAFGGDPSGPEGIQQVAFFEGAEAGSAIGDGNVHCSMFLLKIRAGCGSAHNLPDSMDSTGLHVLGIGVSLNI